MEPSIYFFGSDPRTRNPELQILRSGSGRPINYGFGLIRVQPGHFYVVTLVLKHLNLSNFKMMSENFNKIVTSKKLDSGSQIQITDPDPGGRLLWIHRIRTNGLLVCLPPGTISSFLWRAGVCLLLLCLCRPFIIYLIIFSLKNFILC